MTEDTYERKKYHGKTRKTTEDAIYKKVPSGNPGEEIQMTRFRTRTRPRPRYSSDSRGRARKD